MTLLAFVDTETTGLDPDVHQVWEVAAVLRDIDTGMDDVEWVWQLPVDVSKADPMALQIGGFYERRQRPASREWMPRPFRAGYSPDESYTSFVLDSVKLPQWCAAFAALLSGAHWFGIVPAFDWIRLDRLCRQHGSALAVHYHLHDVEDMAVGAVHDGVHGAKLRFGDDASAKRTAELTELPYRTDPLLDWFGVHVPAEDRHTALGDARACRDLWDSVTDWTRQPPSASKETAQPFTYLPEFVWLDIGGRKFKAHTTKYSHAIVLDATEPEQKWIQLGFRIAGTGIPADTFVYSLPDGNVFQMSEDATASTR